MVNIKDKYFSLNRILLLTLGLWPYDKSLFARLQPICFFIIIASLIIFQLTIFITTKCTADLLLKVFSVVFACIMSVIKYYSFFINQETVKNLLEQIQHMYDNLKDNNEIAIVEKYGNSAKRYTIFLTMFGSFVCALMSTFLKLDFLHLILSANQTTSQPRHLYIMVEYFVDQEKYFYFIVFHLQVALIMGTTAVLAVGTMLISLLRFACGMFRIASYRIEHIMEIHTLKDVRVLNDKIYENIIYAIKIHREAIMFCNHFTIKFEASFLLLVVFGVTNLSLNLYRMVMCNNIEEFPVIMLCAFSCLIYMFIGNFLGQNIINHNNNVYATAYKVQWYIAPLHIQKLLLFLLLRGNKAFGLNIGGLFIASLEYFATLINASMSYFIVLYSMSA